MAFEADTIEPPVGNPPQTPPDTTGDAKLRLLHTAVGKEYNLGSFDDFKRKIQDPTKRQKLYDAIGKEYNLGSYDQFQTKLGFGNKPEGASPSQQVAPETAQAPPPEHEIVHTPIQDIRHVQEMANRPIPTHVVDPQGGLTEQDPEAAKQSKAFNAQYDKLTTDLGAQWNAKPQAIKQVLQDFPDEQDESRLQKNVQLAENNPVGYSRLKNGNDLRMKMAADGPGGVHDANIFNHLLDAQNYEQLTQENIPYQIQLMWDHGMGKAGMDKLKETQRSLINSMDQGLLGKYWNSKDKEYGLTPDEYAGLETERLFNPNKAQMDESIIKHSRGIGEDGKANPLDMSTQSYAYKRGVENIKYNLQQTGRENMARHVAEHKANIDQQAQDLSNQYRQSISAATNPAEQNQLIQEFNNHPVIQESNKLEEASDALRYSEAEDYRRYPLNFADQATRAVSDAMDHTSGIGKDVLKLGGTVLQGAGETSDNTMRFIKNVAINILGSDERKAINSAQNIGHQSLTELASYQPTSYTGNESPILVPRETTKAVQDILNGSGTDDEKQQKAIAYIRDNFDQLKANPKAGQQNLTGKAALFQAANVMGQIIGVANQSFLLGGAIGDASKLQQMASAFTPMFMSTQNQMYEQALKNGDEHPLAKSTVNATILSLASLINPDLKVVKGMVGAETGVGKMIAGLDEGTWNKVLSDNKPLLDKLIGSAKATGRQLGLANLQYGIIAPTAQYVANKAIFNEDANLPDMIKDGIIQTSISMAMPALLHGVWGGRRATEVNPQQKYAIVEAGLHPDQNIDLIEDKIKSGTISEIQGHEMKQLIKHSGEILQNTEMVKTDGSPMNEKEVADTVYSMLRKKVLEGKLKTAAEPVKPIIEEKIHEVNKEIADLHTSESDQHKNELNQLLHDNLDRIKDKAPEFEQTVKDAIAANNPEEAFKVIADKANETKKVEGKETSLRPEAEEIYGKPLVEKALELEKQKTKDNGKTNEAEAGNEKTGVSQEKTEDAPTLAGDASSILEPEKSKENAIQEPSPSSVLQHPQEGTGIEGGGRERVEPSQQGQVPPEQGSGPQAQQNGSEVPSKEVDKDWPFIEHASDDKITSTRNAVTEQKVESAGLVPAMKEAAREFGTVWKDAQDKIKKGVDVQKLIESLKKKPRSVTDTENAMILYHQNIKESQLDAVDKEISDAWEKGDSATVTENKLLRNSILDDLQDIYNVDKSIGRETARGLNARKMMVDRRFSLVNMQMERRGTEDGRPLSETEQADVEKRYQAIKEAKDAYEKRIYDLESENKALKALAETTKERGPKKSSAQYSNERKDIIQRMRDDLLRAAKGGEGLTSSIPLAAQLKAIAPHIADLVKSFVNQGVDKLEDVTAGIHSLLKPMIPEVETKHIHDLIAGEFKDPEIKLENKEESPYVKIKKEAKQQKYAITDPELMKLRADYERQKDAWTDDLKKIELNKRSKFNKISDAFVKWQRAFKLSGITTLAKLGMAAATRLTTTPIEEGVGAAYSKALPRIAKNATGEGGANIKAEAKAIASAFTQGLKDSADIMSGKKRGKSDIESIFGKKGELPPEAIGFFGQLHSAIKAPVKRAAFERSMTKRIAANLKNKVDVTDPLVQSKIAIQAYKDAQRSIFMQDNFVSEKYRNFVNSLEKSESHPKLGKGAATLMQWMIPFVKVPTNIVGEIGTHTVGLGVAASKIAHAAFTKGLENLTEDEADMVMRNLKKGSLGAGALLLGYFNPKIFGGYYHQGEKRDKKDAPAGGMNIDGTKVPVWLLESPIFQTMQLGSTIRRVKDGLTAGSKPQGVGEAVWAGALGLAEHEPLIDQPRRILDAMSQPKERDYFVDEMAKSTIEPALLQNIADFTDKSGIKHSPTDLKQHLEMGIPGLRQTVPVKGATKK